MGRGEAVKSKDSRARRPQPRRPWLSRLVTPRHITPRHATRLVFLIWDLGLLETPASSGCEDRTHYPCVTAVG